MKTFKRSYKDKMLDGVLGGLAETLGISALWVRLAFGILFVLSGGFIPALVYMALSIFLPEREVFAEKPQTDVPKNEV